MWAAAEGHSKLGIPKEVGEEFVRHDADQTPPELGDLTEYEAAEAMRDGEIVSPSKYGDFWLFDLRITGTGLAWRESLGEWAHRDPELWTSPEFVERCKSLLVIWKHPPPGKNLDHDEFQQRVIGVIMLPYLKGTDTEEPEVWGIARIYDEDAAVAMQTTHRSTSPGVTPPKGSKAISLESGAQVLNEGLPLVLDHLAVCEAGVWDKNGPPEGVRLDSLIGKGEVVAESAEELQAKLDAALAERDSEKARADSAMSERDDAMAKLDAREREDKARKDAEEAEKERLADAKRADRKKRFDAEKKDGESFEEFDKRCDAEETEEEKKALEAAEREREDAKRRDAAKTETVEAGRGTEDIKDSKTLAQMQAQIDQLTRAQRPLSIEERDELSRSYHRYDSLFQMLMDSTPQPLPGETPTAYRKRCANAARKYTTSFKNYVFHDSQQSKDFELVETAIFDEAMAYAKNPPADKMAGQVREIKDSMTLPGKIITRFVGDQDAIWGPFGMAVPRRLAKINTQPHAAAH